MRNISHTYTNFQPISPHFVSFICFFCEGTLPTPTPAGQLLHMNICHVDLMWTSCGSHVVEGTFHGNFM